MSMNRENRRAVIVRGLVALASFVACAHAMGQDLEDSPLALGAGLGEHMVVQRDAPVSLRGTAVPGETLEVRLGDVAAEATTDDAGRWAVELPPFPAGGPHVLEVRGEEGRSLEAGDVLVGDVFLCSGQSNMAWPVSASSGAPWGPMGPDAGIRLLHVNRAAAPTPQEVFEGEVAWQVASAESVQPFSGVCWHFAQALRETRPDVPLGLVHSSWGGSRIEPWIPAGGLADLPAYEPRLALLSRYAADPQRALAEHGADWEAWWQERNEDTPWNEAGTDAEGWTPAPSQLGNWQTWSEEWSRFTGMVWYHSRFELDDDQAGQDATLVLGPVDEVDSTWINGRFIASRFGWGDVRRHAVPAAALAPGENTLVVNVYNSWGAGGLTGPAEEIRLELANGDSVPVSAAWRMRAVAPDHPAPNQPPWESIGGLTGLHNAMVAPLGPRALAGALWYQGESNTGEGRRYAPLLSRLTAAWRRQFGAELPVLVIQLPGFGQPQVAPVDSGWAQLRDGQRQVAAREAHTALVVTLDLGDNIDLHPPHKAEVGRRAANVWQSLHGEAQGVVDGITPVDARAEDGSVVVRFAPGQGPFTPLGGAMAHGFELCAADGADCRFVPGTVDGDAVVLAAGDGPAGRVRHCWADAPSCNLVGMGNLPVSSFELPVSP